MLAGQPWNEVHASPTPALMEHHEHQVALAGDDVVVVRDVVEAVDEQPGEVVDGCLPVERDAGIAADLRCPTVRADDK